jgi:hypothetical protein
MLTEIISHGRKDYAYTREVFLVFIWQYDNTSSSMQYVSCSGPMSAAAQRSTDRGGYVTREIQIPTCI